MRQYITKKIIGGVVFAIGFFGTTILAVAISGTIKTWTSGEVLKSADLNTTIASLKTAIEGIPEWTKNGTTAYYSAGSVGIGTSGVDGKFHIRNQSDAGSRMLFRIDDYNAAGNSGTNLFIQGGTQELTIASTWHALHFGASGGGSSVKTISLATSGNVGIGTTTPAEKLEVQGNIKIVSTATCTLGGGAGATSCTSDSRMKKDITPLQNSLDKILKLNGVSFGWKKETSGDKHIGIIAQDVEKVFPELVSTDNVSGYKMVAHSLLIAPIIESIKELALRLRSVNEQSDIAKREGEKTLSLLQTQTSRLLELETENKKLSEEVKALRTTSLQSITTTQRLEERLRAVENMQLARK